MVDFAITMFLIIIEAFTQESIKKVSLAKKTFNGWTFNEKRKQHRKQTVVYGF